MTRHPTPPSGEAEALPTLPVVAWRRFSVFTGWHFWGDEQAEPGSPDAQDLTPHAPAEAAIVALRAEVDQVRRKWLGHRDTGHLSLIEAADKIVGDLHAEVERLTHERDEACAQPSADETLNEDDMYTLIGHAQICDDDMRRYFLGLAQRVARAHGDSAGAARCARLAAMASQEKQP